jgi:hypothetical protein
MQGATRPGGRVTEPAFPTRLGDLLVARGIASDEEIREAARQFVRKVSGFGAPSSRHVEAFEAAVDEVTDSSRRLLETNDATLRSSA